jgi:hypothetical protein
VFPNDHPLNAIPSVEAVRHHLTNSLRDVRLLRNLLKLSEKAEQERARRQNDGPEATRAN